MPSLNQAAFIEAAARSVLQQDYPAVELLVADGGSTDGTHAILERLSREFGDRLRWRAAPDSGPANAVNKALALARGDIVGWLNADDLYTPGAVAVAVALLQANPSLMMVFGEADHIDETDRILDRYPTLPATTPLASFQGGCFICQPSAFLRRRVFDEIGALDERLSTAFDFDLWLRVFRAFPGRIANLPRVQAKSRLHATCITRRMRRTIAAESVRVLARHLGDADPHWLLTYVEEQCASYPHGDSPADLRQDVDLLAAELAGCFSADSREFLRQRLAMDARLRLALPEAFATVTADGWATGSLRIRLRQVEPVPGRQRTRSFRPVVAETSLAGTALTLLVRLRSRLRRCLLGSARSYLHLACRHAAPLPSPLSLTVRTGQQAERHCIVAKQGRFSLFVPLAAAARPCAEIEIIAEQVFVPGLVDERSSDMRELSFRVEAMTLI
ncbi:glycosyltransferase family 2 protein [Accumulibacter sp.]|uniref:glycosyltransferase family 2 protein n=1 Tax=Accumulibacter sp. TaxID=2053492 RepID=UPI001AC95BC2|nr:glycosyltransferase family 2 protein [Accumulibacter sp.]MBN8451872.1 glycosyltransferase [Accumulibacter sp.]MBO3706617.1 glycosyltransferase [Candidatus Accumulibacter conexus]